MCECVCPCTGVRVQQLESERAGRAVRGWRKEWCQQVHTYTSVFCTSGPPPSGSGRRLLVLFTLMRVLCVSASTCVLGHIQACSSCVGTRGQPLPSQAAEFASPACTIRNRAPLSSRSMYHQLLSSLPKKDYSCTHILILCQGCKYQTNCQTFYM